jgi:hypothetical protein
MTLNELIEKAKKVSRKFSSGDIPLWMNGEEVDLALRDVDDQHGLRVSLEVVKKPMELPEVRLRQEICICCDNKRKIDELLMRGIVKDVTYNIPSCDVELSLHCFGTKGETGDWLVLDEHYFWRIMRADLHKTLKDQGKIIMI